MTHIDTNSSLITPADGNVFLDLGFGTALAAILKAESQEIIETQLAAKHSG
ncbi:hypothetical protein [Herbaspirillum chlorophenolicum]|uniref:hypothetical protein n=1 Tax=Herbaspirillum chlorophenolicum TaxID=211589 RepID=UPI000A45F953|nr:hypothetical protein [Herbaspirillum chlorophenolicum]